jgi:hypothetical protein
MKEIKIRLPDWVYQFFNEKWPEDRYEKDSELGLEWYISWKVSEMVSDQLEESRRSRGVDKGVAPISDKTTHRSVHVHP